jgi:hypothetical protein
MALFATWARFLARHHGKAPASPFLEASEGCTLSSRQLTNGAPVRVVEDNAQCASLTFDVHGDHCSVKLSQYKTPLLRIDLSQPGGVREAADGTTLLDVPVDGTTVRIRERSIFDLAAKLVLEKARRRP